MIRFLLLILLLLLDGGIAASEAAVEIGLDGQPTVTVQDVYQRNGTLFLGVREILPPLGLNGTWDTGRHLYRIHTAAGVILISPASRYLRYGGRSIALKQKPRFIDGELRVPEEVVTEHLPRLLDLKIVYRPVVAADAPAIEAPADENAPKGAPLKGLRQIIIDVGHGGTDPGAISPEGDKEKDLVLAIALRLEKLCKRENDLPVLLTRNADYALSLTERTPAGSGWPEENLLLSLHLGAGFDNRIHGIDLFTLPAPAEGFVPEQQLADCLASALRAEGLIVRAPVTFPLLPLSRASMPAILLDLGYLTNPDDLRLLRSAEGQDRLARALYRGIRAYAESLKEIP